MSHTQHALPSAVTAIMMYTQQGNGKKSGSTLQVTQKQKGTLLSWQGPIQRTHGGLNGLWGASLPQKGILPLACEVPMQRSKSRWHLPSGPCLLVLFMAVGDGVSCCTLHFFHSSRVQPFAEQGHCKAGVYTTLGRLHSQSLFSSIPLVSL